MKQLFALLLVIGTMGAYADTIGSFATGASNLGNINSATNFAGMSSTPTIINGTNPTFMLNPNGVWAAALSNSTWIGYSVTAGPGGVNPPGTINAPEYYTFTTEFSVIGPDGSTSFTGSLTVLADDTTAVFQNGVMLIGPGALGGDMHCAEGVPNCLVPATVGFSGAGVQTLTFLVTQAGSGEPGLDPSGLDFSGVVNFAPGGIIPEPATLALLSTGLLAIAAQRRRFC